MQFKEYQQKTLEQLDRYLEAVKEARKSLKAIESNSELESLLAGAKDYPSRAWENLKEKDILPVVQQEDGVQIPNHISRTADSGAPIPHVCLKVPTGGGKTLLGVAALGRIKQDKGFVLWIVPTKAIYQQTLESFRSREHPYRQMLEHTCGGKVKLLQKNDLFTRQDIENYLCIMLLMLPSANRKKNKEFLKIFRDHSGYTSFFPEQDNAIENSKLAEEHPDLEKNSSNDWVKQSLINVLKLIQPMVVLDEAHKAYGSKDDKKNKEFVKSVNRLNPRFVLELSATPKIGISNILVNVSGTELNDEEMIKMPIEIRNFDNSNWQRTLAETQKKLNELEKSAEDLKKDENRYIRPIAVVRVERTGSNQRDKGKIHADHAREYLIRHLSVPENQIRVKASNQDELQGEDLFNDRCPVRWIITKDALKEGWDCSFAYVLALLDNTTALTSITQMIGRVMRQPQARRVESSNNPLNRCYIYCFNEKVSVAADKVKAGLEAEGLTGLGDLVRGYGEGEDSQPQTVRRRKQYKRLRIFLPQVLHKKGKQWRPLDYDRDILNAISWDKLKASKVVDLDDREVSREIIATVDLQGGNEPKYQSFDSEETLELDYFVRRLDDLVPNPWQASRVAADFIRRYKQKKHSDAEIVGNRVYLSEILKSDLAKMIDQQAEKIFGNKVRTNEIKFHLETDAELNYELEKSFEILLADERTLQGKHGELIQRSLFEPVYESEFNNLEKDFALYLEKSEAVHWWHRVASRQGYFLRGWRRDRIYPDFIVSIQKSGAMGKKLLVLETKGKHLKDNPDSNYKKNVLKTLEETYDSALERGELEVKEEAAVFRMMFEDTWKEDINSILETVKK